MRKRFDLSERQAQAILDLRLARLTKLEVFKLEEELKQLKELIKKLTAIVGSKQRQLEVVKEEILEIKKKYPSPRRSVLVETLEDAGPVRADVRAPGVESLLCISYDGMLKCVTEKNFSQSNKELGAKTKPNNIMKTTLSIMSDCDVWVFSDRGNCFRLRPEQAACRFTEAGYSLADLFEDAQEGELPVALFPADTKEGDALFYTERGMIKRTAWSEYNVGKPFFQAIRINEDDRVIGVETDTEEKEETIFFVTKLGMCLNARKDDIPSQGRIAGGVKGINLNEGDEVVFAAQIDGEGRSGRRHHGREDQAHHRGAGRPAAEIPEGHPDRRFKRGRRGAVCKLRHHPLHVGACVGGRFDRHFHRGRSPSTPRGRAGASTRRMRH